MKKLVLLLLISLSTVGVLLAAIAEQPSGDWKKVKDAMDKRRPKTAIEELEPIIQSALQANRYDEATKAIALKIVLEGSIEGNRAEERISRLQKILPDQPRPMQPVMEVILANWYWDYFRQNRWRFMQARKPSKARARTLRPGTCHGF